MPAATEPTTPDFDLVLVGADIGVYALARAFHEQYGTISTVVSRQVTGPVDGSAFIVGHVVGADAQDEQLVAKLVELAQARSIDRPTLLLGNADWIIQMFSDHLEQLEQHYLLPILSAETLAAVSDKAEFAQICEQAGIATPRTITVDFAAADQPGFSTPRVHLEFPVVAKAARSSAYAHVEFEGKRKVFTFDSQDELDAMFTNLLGSGYRDRFVVQELIPGDDTAMRSITAYCDRHGHVTMLGGAQVLLEEHTPVAMGNPAAMFTCDLGTMFDQALEFLRRTDYRGFANFDVKVDPRDGVGKFLEVNPRIGRNNYYMTAAGLNVSQFVVRDQVLNEEVEPQRLNREILYSIVPTPMLMHYITDPALKRRVKRIAHRITVHPLRAAGEGFRRKAYLLAATLNQVKKFATYYPKPTSTGF